MTNLLIQIDGRSGKYRMLAGDDVIREGDYCLWCDKHDAWTMVDRGSSFIGMTTSAAGTAFVRAEAGY